MSDSMSAFKDWLSDTLPEYAPQYRHFNGDLMCYLDEHKDWICFAFLEHFPSWWDDFLPPCLVRPNEFLAELYAEAECGNLYSILRDDIYLALESTLCPIVQEVYNDVYNVETEEFAGYEVGQ